MTKSCNKSSAPVPATTVSTGMLNSLAMDLRNSVWPLGMSEEFGKIPTWVWVDVVVGVGSNSSFDGLYGTIRVFIGVYLYQVFNLQPYLRCNDLQGFNWSVRRYSL